MPFSPLRRDTDLRFAVEQWIETIVDTGGHDELLAISMPQPLSTPTGSPAKRSADTAMLDACLDLDRTPRGPVSEPGPPESELSSNYDDSSNRDSKSRASSPTKRSRALHLALVYPLNIAKVTELDQASAAENNTLPAWLIPLASDLQNIGEGDVPVIPRMFKSRMDAESGRLNKPKDRWFLPDGSDRVDGEVSQTVETAARDKEEQILAHRIMDWRLREVWRASQKCGARREHEPAWNDTVHSPLLAAALDGLSGVEYRNITSTRILPTFRDPDTDVGNTKVDYGIFLKPPPGTTLESALAKLPGSLSIVHMDLCDSARTPLAVSVETKSLHSALVKAHTQLVIWARAHFRQLARLRGLDMNNAALPAAERAVLEAWLPVLPLVCVNADEWFVSFARLVQGKMVVYEKIALGSTDSLDGCYRVRAGIRRLGGWAAEELTTWWVKALGSLVP